ncbi:MAG TPA: MBL fold metallo-hydrolase [Nitrospiraceae bacterium]|nr:MBL fold metallo-hydrolase [Nitrospiraceae bacterium]
MTLILFRVADLHEMRFTLHGVMALEDDFSDIIKKARYGQQRSVTAVAQASGVAESEIENLERGRAPRHPEQVAAVAQALGLRPEPLAQIAAQSWTPRGTASLEGLDIVLGSVGGYEVKGYLLHNNGEAIIVDTGYNPNAMLELLARRKLKLRAICLTHGHADHADGLRELLAAWPVPVYLGPGDRDLLPWTPPADVLRVPENGHRIDVGTFTVSFMTTPGHTPGGICYRVDQAEQPLCFVGDTVFAGSIGRSNPANLYQTHLDSVRRRVLKLDRNTLLFPGHGPATTVAQEQVHNPFASEM